MKARCTFGIQGMSVNDTSPHAIKSENHNVFAPEDIVAFTDLILHSDVDAALSHLIDISSMGIDSVSILIGLIAPSARLLAMRWDDDAVDSGQVSKGMHKLRKLVCDLSYNKHLASHSTRHGGTVLMVAVPGELHTIGAMIAGSILSQDGWTVTFLSGITSKKIVSTVRNTRFNLIALSVSNDQLLAELKELIKKIKKSSMNADATIVVGGTAINASEVLCTDMGADITYREGCDFMESARKLRPSAASS